MAKNEKQCSSVFGHLVKRSRGEGVAGFIGRNRPSSRSSEHYKPYKHHNIFFYLSSIFFILFLKMFFITLHFTLHFTIYNKFMTCNRKHGYNKTDITITYSALTSLIIIKYKSSVRKYSNSI